VADVVLVAADAWTGACRLLPAGPFREPLTALRRASVVVITCKMATDDRVDAVRRAVAAAAPAVPVAVLGLEAEALRPVRAFEAARPASSSPEALRPEAARPEAVRPDDAAARPLAALAGRHVLAVSAIGDPASFEARLRASGARVESRRWPDHHAFTAAECAALAADAGPETDVVCTLKDAVKLVAHWPRAAAPLWYVSQTIVVRTGAQALDGAVGRVLAARRAPETATPPTAG
jgi:tetraacyldisaccharide 4'-kinase